MNTPTHARASPVHRKHVQQWRRYSGIVAVQKHHYFIPGAHFTALFHGLINTLNLALWLAELRNAPIHVDALIYVDVAHLRAEFLHV